MNAQEFFDMLNEDTKYTTINGQYPHKHKYNIDEKGDGQTTKVIGDGPEHFHKIESWDVKPAGDDKHIHFIRQQMNPE
jgi:hypothetical protein